MKRKGEGKMAKKRGWWKITFTVEPNYPYEVDLEHIAKKIKEGYTEGEIVESE